MRAAIIVLAALVAVATADNQVGWSPVVGPDHWFQFAVDVCGRVDCSSASGGCVTSGTVPDGETLKVYCSNPGNYTGRPRLRFNMVQSNAITLEAGNTTLTNYVPLDLEHGTYDGTMRFRGVNIGRGMTLGPRTDLKRSQSYNVMIGSLTLTGATYTNTESPAVLVSSQFTCTGNGAGFSAQEAWFEGAMSQTTCNTVSTGATYVLASATMSSSNIYAGTELGIQAGPAGFNCVSGTCQVTGNTAFNFYSQPSTKKRGEERDPPIVVPGGGTLFGGGGNGGTSGNPLVNHFRKRSVGERVPVVSRESEIVTPASILFSLSSGTTWSMPKINTYSTGSVPFAVSAACSAQVTCACPQGVSDSKCLALCPPVNCGSALNPNMQPTQEQCDSNGICQIRQVGTDGQFVAVGNTAPPGNGN